MVRRRGTPSQNWRSFLHNHAASIATIDMFVVACASFQLLYVMIILDHHRRKISHTAVTDHPTAAWLLRQVTEAFPWDPAPRYLLRDSDASYGSYFCSRVEAMSITEVVTAPRSPWQNGYVEREIGSISPQMLGSHGDLQRAPSAPRPVLLRRLLPRNSHASFARQGLPRLPRDYATQDRKDGRHPESRRPASSLRTSLRLIRTQSPLTNGCVAPGTPSVDDLCIEAL